MQNTSISATTQTIKTTCCIVGGGPAGMVLGYLLARAGIDVIVLEKHADFLRDFRGDTIHPSTLELMGDLGILESFLQQPHHQSKQLVGYIGDDKVVIADFTHLKVRCPFIALIPQWNFLNFLAEQAKQYPSFQLMMQANVTDIIREQSQVTGVKVSTPQGMLDIHATLVVGADGRHSTVREKAGLEVQDIGAPMDVLWMRCSRLASDPEQPMGRFDEGKIFIMIDRGDYWQCAYIIPKGSFNHIQEQGLEVFWNNILKVAPFLENRIKEISSWDDVKLLTVSVNRLRSWFQSGLLCIGDSAHAMSPIGGVGINLAIQDAIATANLLTDSLSQGQISTALLSKVQRRREFPTRMTQAMQVLVQKRVVSRIMDNTKKVSLPWFMRFLLNRSFPRRIVARLVGLGVRLERIKQ